MHRFRHYFRTRGVTGAENEYEKELLRGARLPLYYCSKCNKYFWGKR